MTKIWEYRAINRHLQIVNGTAEAPSFIQLSVDLRQRQLQVIEANQIHRDKKLANERLQTMKQSINKPELLNTVYRQHTSSNTSNWLYRIIRFLSGS